MISLGWGLARAMIGKQTPVVMAADRPCAVLLVLVGGLEHDFYFPQ